jgi:hypothetical protein
MDPLDEIWGVLKKPLLSRDNLRCPVQFSGFMVSILTTKTRRLRRISFVCSLEFQYDVGSGEALDARFIYGNYIDEVVYKFAAKGTTAKRNPG